MNDLAGILIFSKVVEAKTFTAAAESLGMSTAQVSKEISRLEKSLGAHLLNRTTRKMSLTEVGSIFYEHSKRISDEIEAAKASVASHHIEATGTLRVNAPVAFGVNHIAPAIGVLMKQHPKLQIELMLNDRAIDLAEDGFDLAIRITRLPHATLAARPLAPIRLVICGALAYFEKHGVPSHPGDLTSHNCLTYPQITTNNCWEYIKDGRSIQVPVAGNFVANSSEALRIAAIDGIGVAILPTFIVGNDLKTNRLQQILPEYETPAATAYAVYLPNRHLPPKTRAFIDFFVERFQPTPYWDTWE